jgi:gamma-glutamyl:cysteine ligase YbdK (ATP-grasp superfamily)
MLEAAATSFQIHYKVDIDYAVEAYNVSRALSAPVVAMAANSPFLFGHNLWAESRIPLFEQAVRVGGSAYSNRVSFGIRHAGKSIMECFNVNRVRYPTLLPQLLDTPPEELAHLRMHNGTIWRWNRPLVGFSGAGEPHIRIEHRVPAAGPSMIDTVSNAAFYFGALTALLDDPQPIAEIIPNRNAAHNFYECAKHGLKADVLWKNNKPMAVKELIVKQLLPLAKKGLVSIGYESSKADHWLDIIRERVKSGQNGATWQRKWVAQHGSNLEQLVLSYHENQVTNSPVHTWTL